MTITVTSYKLNPKTGGYDFFRTSHGYYNTALEYLTFLTTKYPAEHWRVSEGEASVIKATQPAIVMPSGATGGGIGGALKRIPQTINVTDTGGDSASYPVYKSDEAAPMSTQLKIAIGAGILGLLYLMS
jgi:hypothetical protein